MTMPEWLNAATGLDALTHGIESFVSLAHNPLADIHALNAVGLVCRHLRTTIDRPDASSPRGPRWPRPASTPGWRSPTRSSAPPTR